VKKAEKRLQFVVVVVVVVVVGVIELA